MSNAALKSAGLVIIIIVLAGISQAVSVDGYCYLENQTNHAGTKVLFEADSPGAVTDSTYTNTIGYYQIDLQSGVYNIHYTHEYYWDETLVRQILVSSTTLPEITLSAFPAGIYISGPLSGMLEDTIYLVIGNISVENGDSLIINPGTTLLFIDYYEFSSFNVYGVLMAQGTEQDSIAFLPHNQSEWGGIEFYSSSLSSGVLEYCNILYASDAGITCTSSSPTISHCIIRGNSAGIGGGINSNNCNSIISHCVITENTAISGAGIYIDESDIVIANCNISNNSAYGGAGGGIYCDDSALMITDCTINENTSPNYGGGIGFNWNEGSIIVSNCTINGNTSSEGGGIRIYHDLDLTIENCTINGNHANSYGGGILIKDTFDYPTPFTNCIISGNTSGSGGSGIHLAYNTEPTISHSTISGNSASEAAIWNDDGSEKPVLEYCTITDNLGNGINGWFTIAGCTIKNNGGYGILGADSIRSSIICYNGGDGIVSGNDIINCTVSNNFGNGIECSGETAVITNTIISNNGNTGISGIIPNIPITYSNIFNNTNGNFSGSLPQWLGQIITINANGDSCDLGVNIYEDPLFEDPINGNFQITWVNYPVWDETRSPCIDAGDPNSRYDPDNTIADIGAFYFDQGMYPNIEVSTDSLTFSSVPLEYEENLPLTVYSVGDDTLVIYNIYTSEPSFSTDYNPADSLVAPRDSLALTVTFTPAEIGNYSEILTIENNDELTTVTLKGKGVGPVDVNLYPYDPPIIVPSGGGSFDYMITLENRTPDQQVFDLWLEIILPDSQAVPVLNRLDIVIPGDYTTQRDLTQTIPSYAPAGLYYYFAYAGSYPDMVEDQGWFTFEKEGSDGGYLGSPSDWICSGEGFDNIGIGGGQAPALPKNYSLYSAYPNPFNPETTIRFDLPEACWVKLEVFDIKGRKVGSVGFGESDLQAGTHEITFDGMGLSSGIYFYRIQAGGFVSVQKMVLLK